MKTELDKNEKPSTEQESPPIANVLLAAAASDTPTNDKINTLYKMYNDWSNEDLEQVSSCR